MMQRLLKVCEN